MLVKSTSHTKPPTQLVLVEAVHFLFMSKARIAFYLNVNDVSDVFVFFFNIIFIPSDIFVILYSTAFLAHR